MINHFTFNGTSTAQLGLIVSGVSIFGAGSRKVEKAGIPGRNGDLQIELGGFNNYTVRYTVSITKNFTTTAQQIREWLLESKGYCDLTDTYHPDEIRKACFNSDIEFTTSMLYKYGQASIQFDCLPERYLTTNTPITTTATADTTTDTTLSLSTVPTPITISLNGNTTQEGTPSPTNPQVIHNVSGDNEVKIARKNIFTFPSWQTVNSAPLYNGYRKVKLLLPPNTTYYLNTTFKNGYSPVGLNMYVLVGDYLNTVYKSIAHSTYGAQNGTVTTNADGELYISVYNATQAKYEELIENSQVQLEKGSTATPYEPYTRQSYPLYLPVENLIPTGMTSTSNDITFTVNADGSVLVNGTATNTAWFVVNMQSDKFKVGEYYTFGAMPKGVDTNTVNGFIGGLTSSNQWGQETPKTIQATTINSPQFVIRVTNGTTVNNMLFYPQLEKGSKANHYTPYGTTPIELNKIGTYQDYIYKNGGKWYVHKEFNKIDLGTLTWNRYQFGSNYAFYVNVPTKYSGQSVGGLCETYPVTRNATGPGMLDNKTMDTQSNQTYIYIRDDSYTDARTFKTSLNGVLLYYPLRTATNTEITDTTLINQLNNIEKAYSYNGTTNILQVSNDNGFMLGVVSLHGSTFNSNYKGEPIITVNSTGLIYLNGEVMEVLSAPVTINCQTMQCYNGVVNMNNEVRVNDFPEIKIGSNEVGSSMALTITPNNWRH